MGSLLIVFQILVLLFSVVIHEVAHGAMALSLGDQTAKRLGRLTLNPVVHLDLVGSILLPIFLYIISMGGFVFGYAKPVPYNPLNLRDRRYGPAKVAIAGPLANIIVALIFGLALRFLPAGLTLSIIPQLFALIVFMNLLLAIFNLIPIPPLDGHWLLLTFLPDSLHHFKQAYLQYGMILFIFALFFIFPTILPAVTGLFRLIVGAPIDFF
ncbi:MAG: site-2 protease family protein [Candidatus Yanofskybacteria bacterium CG10_big_fil_rev_8_21_14_0_10_46_23]|uniref:Site-2 protease family protein n=1 Tax=Candidatus Yanofskybacteria bacterium CG10_big_fil_rev_8_21_14_0_10_46_23 TaxID=1975098 RepID=A0A2H0R3Y6_9BACT|nr:MAG: site-2 protease family protein [Candidatus Yanofskybacteria bacterium CG10_big_fil_rev_8_21_14_0_10_46_23]